MVSTHLSYDKQISRRKLMAVSIASSLPLIALSGCSPEAISFNSIDLTGAAYAKDFRLQDHNGNVRTLSDFREKIAVIFFGFTQCPDVCPTSMATMAEVKRLLGSKGSLLQVLFVTVDPERDTLPVLKEYMLNFDPAFLALRPELGELKSLAEHFKVYYKKIDGKTPTSYTMDRSVGVPYRTYVLVWLPRIPLD